MPPTSSLLSLKPEGVPVAMVEITPPPGNVDKRIYAVLRSNGRIVARGESSTSENGLVKLTLQSTGSVSILPNGNYELWVKVDKDGQRSWYPGFTDIYLKEMWQLLEVPFFKTIMAFSDWKEKRLSKSENLLRIHYHRYDENYDDFGLWTWNANPLNPYHVVELFEVGHDEFGLIFELDQADYGDCDEPRIGLLPRQAEDWRSKDGTDKIWSPELGSEVYLIGTKDEIWQERPNTDTKLLAAFIDTPHCLEIQLSRLIEAGEVSTAGIKIVDDLGGRVAPFARWLINCNKGKRSNYLKVVTLDHFDLVYRAYSVQVEGFGRALPAPSRTIPAELDLFSNPSAVFGAAYSSLKTVFRVFAPTAKEVLVVLYETPNETAYERVIHPLKRTDDGIWEGIVSGDLKGRFYRYRVDIPGRPSTSEVLDPYCINCSATITLSGRRQLS